MWPELSITMKIDFFFFQFSCSCDNFLCVYVIQAKKNSIAKSHIKSHIRIMNVPIHIAPH